MKVLLSSHLLIMRVSCYVWAIKSNGLHHMTLTSSLFPLAGLQF